MLIFSPNIPPETPPIPSTPPSSSSNEIPQESPQKYTARAGCYCLYRPEKENWYTLDV